MYKEENHRVLIDKWISLLEENRDVMFVTQEGRYYQMMPYEKDLFLEILKDKNS
ncbi:MAG: hypothetical protein J6Y02_21295 [Pseudobutyrivibrio sp.]|nr:hypothetical protein [Pseudobutyrivibrio sp.]